METLQTIWKDKHVTGFRRFFYLVSPNETTFDNLDEIPQYVDDVSWMDAINYWARVEIKAILNLTVYLAGSRNKMDRSHSSIWLRFDLAAVSSILPFGTVPIKKKQKKRHTKGRETTAKVVAAKTVKQSIVWLPFRSVDHCGIVRSILRPISKNEGGRDLHLCPA